MDASREPLRLGRIVATLVVAMFLIEALSQLVVYRFSGDWFRSLSPYVWSSYGLVRNNPTYTSPGFDISPQGFRNVEEFSRAKPSRTFRVILLGGSVLYSGLAPNAYVESEGRVGSDATVAQYLKAKMESDPEFANLTVEVLNAAVNFNRMKEVSVAYLADYARWDPDLVIVFGSANNFGVMPLKGQVYAGDYTNQGAHVWQREFDRIVNGDSFSALVERVLRWASGHSAGIALGKKVLARLIDRVLALSQQYALPGQHTRTDAPGYADRAEVDYYVRDYLSYADAMIATARRMDQEIAFFWEYYLLDVDLIKPLSDDERRIVERIRVSVTMPTRR
jgi:hypothetical protein